MIEPTPKKDDPEEIIYLTQGFLQFSDTFLRAYGHPLLLKVAENINGEDFVPFTEGYFIKDPGLGASVAWHQDGTTHWDNPDWDQYTRILIPIRIIPVSCSVLMPRYGCS